MEDWNGRAIFVARSRGGVFATVNPSDNLVRSGTSPWPPPEILQKLYKSIQGSAFDGQGAFEHLQYYCDLQSLNSEDAITWSFFGPLAYSDNSTCHRYFADLCELIDIPAPKPGNVHVWLWRRLPHPDTLVSGGPEIDFGFQADDLFILGEAKWRSGVGKAQGVAHDKDQITLRREFCNKYSTRLFPDCQRFVVLGVSLTKDQPVVIPYDSDCGSAQFQGRNTTWADLCSLDSHPYAEEVARYYHWKAKASQAALPAQNVFIP